MKYKKYINVAGNILTIITIIIIIYNTVKQKIDISVIVNSGNIKYIVILSFIYTFNIIIGSINYNIIIRMTTRMPLRFGDIQSIYCSSNLYKYLPGNFMQFVGRNRLVLKYDTLSHAEVAISTLIEYLLLFGAAIILTATSTSNEAFSAIKNIKINASVTIIVAIIMIILAIIIYNKRRNIIKTVQMIMRRLKIKITMISLAINISRFAVMAIIYNIILIILGQKLNIHTAVRISGLFILSWMIGFVTPGAPGGLGIRETIMMLFMKNTIDSDTVIASAIIYRIVNIIGDVMAWVYSIIYEKTNMKKLSAASAACEKKESQ